MRKKKSEIVFWLLHQMLSYGPAAIPKGHGARFGHDLSLKALGVWLGAARRLSGMPGWECHCARWCRDISTGLCLAGLKLTLFWKNKGILVTGSKEQGRYCRGVCCEPVASNNSLAGMRGRGLPPPLLLQKLISLQGTLLMEAF